MTFMENDNLRGKVAVITGAGGVLCSNFARELARQGLKVALLDLKVENAEKVVAEIESEGGRALPVAADVLNKESLDKARELVNKQLGSCDFLINGAGGNHPKGTTSGEFFDPKDIIDPDKTSFFDLDFQGVQFVFNLNFLGTLLPTQVFARDMLDKEDCAIINISSMNAFTPLTKIPAYSGAKAAVSNFTQWLAVHFAPASIRVNAIAPGFFVTEQNRSLLFDEGGAPTERARKILNNTPMGRFGEAGELLGTLLWLLDKEASAFITGIVVPVDGGFSAYSGV